MAAAINQQKEDEKKADEGKADVVDAKGPGNFAARSPSWPPS